MGPEAIIVEENEAIHNDMRDGNQLFDANHLAIPRRHYSTSHVATLAQEVRSTPSIADLVFDVSLRIEPVIGVSDSGDEFEQSQIKQFNVSYGKGQQYQRRASHFTKETTC